VEEGKAIMKFLATEISKDTYVNVMEQYRLVHCGLAREIAEKIGVVNSSKNR
jgi:uncharacterized Fe-S radical SAM superfamily protein PflX